MTGITAIIAGPRIPVYISRKGALQTSGSTVGLASVPSSGNTGDFLVTLCCAENAAGVTWTDAVGGYTERVDQGSQPSLRISTKTDGGSETVPSCNSSAGADTVLTMYQFRFRGGNYDTIGSIATTASDGTLTLPAITSAGGLVLAIVVAKAGVTVSTPTGFTQIVNENVNEVSTGMRVAVFSKPAFYAGSTGTVDTTIASIDGTAAGVLLGMK